MKRPEAITAKYAAIGFACMVVAMAILRTVNLTEYTPGAAAAIMLAVLIASSQEMRRSQTPDA